MPIDELIAGLEIIRAYDAFSPVVTSPYIVAVPAVKQAVMTGLDQTAIEALGWVLHPVYAAYYYPAQTITELAEVTGEGSGNIPVISPIIPPTPHTV